MRRPLHTLRLSLSLLLAALAFASPLTVWAQAEPDGYRSAVDEAVREFQAKNFEEARSLFGRAHALSPNARTLRGLGMVEFELRNYGTCIRALEQALASKERPLEGELRSETEVLLSRAQAFVARINLDVRPGARRASVLVDGVPVELGEGGALVLEVGDHVLEVRDEGYVPERRKLSLRGGEQQKLVIMLQKPMDLTRTAEKPRPLYKNGWLWTGVGVVLAGAAVGTAMAMTGTSEQTAAAPGGNSGIALNGPK